MRYRTSYRKRSLGIALALSPFALVAASLLRSDGEPSTALWMLPAALGLLCAISNLWRAMLARLWWKLIGRSGGGYAASGPPLIGTACAVLSCLFAYGSTVPALVALLVLVIDLGGLPWFVIATWRDRSFWDEPADGLG